MVIFALTTVEKTEINIPKFYLGIRAYFLVNHGFCF